MKRPRTAICESARLLLWQLTRAAGGRALTGGLGRWRRRAIPDDECPDRDQQLERGDDQRVNGYRSRRWRDDGLLQVPMIRTLPAVSRSPPTSVWLCRIRPSRDGASRDRAAAQRAGKNKGQEESQTSLTVKSRAMRYPRTSKQVPRRLGHTPLEIAELAVPRVFLVSLGNGGPSC